MDSKLYIEQTAESFEQLIDKVINLVDGVNASAMNKPEAEGKWSMLQCIKHMSLATKLYIRNIEKRLQTGGLQPGVKNFKGGWKGRMFVKMTQPKGNGQITNKLKTFRSMEPPSELDRQTVIDEFIVTHQKFIEVIKSCESVHLDRTKIVSAIPILKFRLGDAFLVMQSHVQRHVVQLERIKKAALS